MTEILDLIIQVSLLAIGNKCSYYSHSISGKFLS